MFFPIFQRNIIINSCYVSCILNVRKAEKSKKQVILEHFQDCFRMKNMALRKVNSKENFVKFFWKIGKNNIV